jgi:hypothetical protein
MTTPMPMATISSASRPIPLPPIYLDELHSLLPRQGLPRDHADESLLVVENHQLGQRPQSYSCSYGILEGTTVSVNFRIVSHDHQRSHLLPC